MRWRGVLIALVFAALAGSQAALTWEQLRAFIQSSVKLKQRDRDVAGSLRKQKLSFSLTEVAIEELQGLGAGPQTVQALRELLKTSRNLPPPPQVRAAAPSQPPAEPAPPPEEQRRIIETARRNALDYSGRLPDFICLQLTRRYVDPTGLELDWRKYDEIKARLTFFEQQEQYQLISVNDRLTDRPLDSLGGATSTGEFGSILAHLFDPKTDAEFTWERHSTLRGRPVYVFRYRVPQQRSKWHISYQREREIIAGYIGLVYIDKDTGMVMRISSVTDGLPRDFPIHEARTALDYGFAEIADQQYLLPLRATVRMREGKLLTRNDVEFRLYRKFSAEATIAFDTAELDAASTENAPEEPPEERATPAGAPEP
jgi:hypothetical protein